MLHRTIVALMHAQQKLCPQGSVMGLINISRQMLQVNSAFTGVSPGAAVSAARPFFGKGNSGLGGLPEAAMSFFALSFFDTGESANRNSERASWSPAPLVSLGGVPPFIRLRRRHCWPVRAGVGVCRLATFWESDLFGVLLPGASGGVSRVKAAMSGNPAAEAAPKNSSIGLCSKKALAVFFLLPREGFSDICL